MILNVPKVDKPTHFLCFDYLDINDVPSVICHLDVFKWNKTTRREILKDILREMLKEPLDKYVVWDGVDKKFLKFVKMVGFVDTGMFTEDYGQIDYMYIWRDV